MNTSRHLGAALAGILMLIPTAAHSAIYDVSGTFIMRNSSGSQVGVTDNFVSGTYDDTNPSSLSLSSPQPFQGLFWAAEGLVFGEGSWTFEACPGDASVNCGSPTPPRPLSMTVDDGQWGGHFLTVWGSSQDIDVVSVWDVTTDLSGIIHLASTDPDGDGVLGTQMVDGPFQGFNWSYDLTLTPNAIPVPPAIWLFGSGILGLIGISKRKKA